MMRAPPTHQSNPSVFLASLVLPGCGASPSQKIAYYATMVGTKGTWLDVLDAGLAGDRLEKDIFFLVTKKEEGLDLFSIKTYMKNHIPDLEIEGHDAPPNRASKDTWVFLSCNASYQHGKNDPRNHWMPCVFREQVEPSLFEELTTESRIRIMREVTVVQKQMSENVINDGEPAITASLEMQRDEFLVWIWNLRFMYIYLYLKFILMCLYSFL